jgi:hypothetical protein
MKFRNPQSNVKDNPTVVHEGKVDESVDIVFDRALGQSRVEAFRDAVMGEEYVAARSIFEGCDNWNERQPDEPAHANSR